MMYKPLYCFSIVAMVSSLIGVLIGIRFLVSYWEWDGGVCNLREQEDAGGCTVSFEETGV